MSINIYEFDIGFGDFEKYTITYKGYYSDDGDKPFKLNPFKKKDKQNNENYKACDASEKQNLVSDLENEISHILYFNILKFNDIITSTQRTKEKNTKSYENISVVTYNNSTINQGFNFFYEIYKNGDQNGIYNYDGFLLSILPRLIPDLDLKYNNYTPSYNQNNEESYIYKWNVGKDKVITFGDLHGSFHTFFRSMMRLHYCGIIDTNFKIKKGYRILFCGDILDRGQYSFEIMAFILKLVKVNNKKNNYKVLLIRGNHEEREMFTENGFIEEYNNKFIKDDILKKLIFIFESEKNLYNVFDNFYNSFNESIDFSKLPNDFNLITQYYNEYIIIKNTLEKNNNKFKDQYLLHNLINKISDFNNFYKIFLDDSNSRRKVPKNKVYTLKEKLNELHDDIQDNLLKYVENMEPSSYPYLFRIINFIIASPVAIILECESKKIWCCHGSLPNNSDFFSKIKIFLKNSNEKTIKCDKNETQKIMWTDLINGTEENSPSERLYDVNDMNYSKLEGYFSELGLDFMIRGHQDFYFNTTFYHNHIQENNFSIYTPNNFKVKHGTSLFDLLKKHNDDNKINILKSTKALTITTNMDRNRSFTRDSFIMIGPKGMSCEELTVKGFGLIALVNFNLDTKNFKLPLSYISVGGSLISYHNINKRKISKRNKVNTRKNKNETKKINKKFNSIKRNKRNKKGNKSKKKTKKIN